MKKITLKEYAKLLKVSHYSEEYGKIRAILARKKLEKSSLTAPKGADQELFSLIKGEVERTNGNVTSFRLAIGQRCKNASTCLMQWTEKKLQSHSKAMWLFTWGEFYLLPGEENGKQFAGREDEWKRYLLYQRLQYGRIAEEFGKLGLKTQHILNKDTVIVKL